MKLALMLTLCALFTTGCGQFVSGSPSAQQPVVRKARPNPAPTATPDTSGSNPASGGGSGSGSTAGAGGGGGGGGVTKSDEVGAIDADADDVGRTSDGYPVLAAPSAPGSSGAPAAGQAGGPAAGQVPGGPAAGPNGGQQPKVVRTQQARAGFVVGQPAQVPQVADGFQASDADPTQASKNFHTLLTEAMTAATPAIVSERVHYVIDDSIEKAMTATTIEQAMQDIAPDSIDRLALNTTKTPLAATPTLQQLVLKKPTTIVVIPGVFAEFIQTRAFDDIFSQPSTYQKQFAQLAQQARQQKNAAAVDSTLDSRSLTTQQVNIEDVVQVGSIDNRQGRPLIKIILFKAPFLSLESVGDLDQQAKTFTRRLEKYLALTGKQDLAFVGYSRGTTTGLQMLSQAQQDKKPWLSQVKAMVSYGGVVMGSTLADQVDDPNNPLAKGVVLMKQLRNGLEVPATKGNIASQLIENTRVFNHNAGVWAQFTAQAALLAPKLAPSNNSPNPDELAGAPTAIDPSAPFKLVIKMFSGMGLSKWFSEYGRNIQRFQAFIDANLTATEQLRTQARKQWWATHTVPTEGITYYSLAAAMADPATSKFQSDLFNATTSYSKSYDDKSLLQNHRDYTKASGVQLNDSQVGVAQAMFLPDVIHGLNNAQAPMKIENLGVLSSHHWGLALRVVNEMKDHRFNPFPRKALIEALEAQIALDQ